MINKIFAACPSGNGITKQVKRAKYRVRMEKLQAAKIDIGLGSAAGALTYLACKAMDMSATVGPIGAVILTPIIGKLLGNR